MLQISLSGTTFGCFDCRKKIHWSAVSSGVACDPLSISAESQIKESSIDCCFVVVSYYLTTSRSDCLRKLD